MSNTSLLGAFGGQAGDALMFRNLLINGNCAIDQRNNGANQTITAAAAYAYTVDRWYAYSSGGNPVGARVAASGAYQFTGASGVTQIGFAQRIEAANSRHLAGGTATLSVDLSNSLLTTVTWTAFYANTNDAFGTRAALTRTQIATGTFTVSSTLSRYSASFAIPSAATTGIEIVFSVGAQTSGTWRIDNAMLEAGPVATPFERRPYSVELGMCQRYLPVINYNTNGGDRFAGCSVNTTNSNCTISFMVQPRTAPTGITVSAANHWSWSNRRIGAGGAGTAVTFQSAGLSTAEIQITTTAGSPTLAAGDFGVLYPSNASAFILFTGCEL